jgi:hypothetical protein
MIGDWKHIPLQFKLPEVIGEDSKFINVIGEGGDKKGEGKPWRREGVLINVVVMSDL